MTMYRTLNVTIFSAALAAAAMTAAPAQAGFEWAAPPRAVAPALPSSETLPLPPVEAVPVAPVETQAVTVTPAAAPDALPPAIAGEKPADFAVVSGFGKDIPLALALRQIVPAQYGYTFDKDVDPGLRLSWNGGKPWNEVLNDMLGTKGLKAAIGQTSVVVSTAPVLAAAEAPALVAPAAEEAVAAPAAVAPAAALPEEPAAVAEAAVVAAPVPLPILAEPKAEPVSAPAAEAAAPLELAPEAQLSSEDVLKARYEQILAEEKNYNPSYPRRRPRAHEEVVKADPAEKVAAAPGETAAAATPPPPVEPVIATDVATAEIADPSVQPVSLAPPVEPVPRAPEAEIMADVPAEASVAVEAAAGNPKAAAVPDSAGVLIAPSNVDSVPVLDPLEIRFWQAAPGDDLRKVLGDWSGKSGVALYWTAGQYALPEGVEMHGTFTEAIQELLSSYNKVKPRPVGRLHPNLPAGPSVLIVEDEGVQQKS